MSKRRKKEPAIEFKPVAGSRVKAADAQVIGTRIMQLSNGEGKVTPDQMVADARNDASPLHRFFEWDDHKAADVQRLERARHLVASVEIVMQYEDGERTLVRGFHSVVINGERGYAPAAIVFSSGDLSRQVSERARRELEGWRKRFGVYQRLSPELAKAHAAVNVAIQKRRPRARPPDLPIPRQPRLRRQAAL